MSWSLLMEMHDRLVQEMLPPRDLSLIRSRLYLGDLAPFAFEFMGTILLCFTGASPRATHRSPRLRSARP